MDETSTLGETLGDVLASLGEATMPHDILPQLPGYRANYQTKVKKKHALKFADKMSYVEDAEGIVGGATTKALVESSSATSLVLGTGKPVYSMGRPKKQSSGPRPVVLSFKAYFKETVHESPLENHRIRKVDILYYLEDHSIQIVERKQQNSGVPQGNFMGRHQVPKDPDSFFTLHDLVIGGIVTIYGRAYHIIDANPSTIDYLDELAKDDGTITTAGERSEYPVDKFEVDRAAKMSRESGGDLSVKHNILKNPMKVFAEAALGNTVDNKGREGFLKYDRKVLRFTCFWDDRNSLYGDMQQFKLHYFLTDDTVECLQVYGANCGRDPYPLLLKRRKLPKDGMNPDKGEVHWTDFVIGGQINMYARCLTIFEADGATRAFYEEQGQPLGEPIQPPQDVKPTYEKVIPPYTGFGTEADSLTSCMGSLVQTAPKKMLVPDQAIRFLGRLDSTAAEDVGREFVLQYFLNDRTLSIREVARRNSGIVGGNFLKRGQDPVKTNDGKLLLPAQLFIGATIPVAGFAFILTDSDDATLKFMETKGDLFPYSSYTLTMTQWGAELQLALDDDSIYKACSDCAKDGTGTTLNVAGLGQLLDLYKVSYNEQTIITVARRLGQVINVDTLVAQLKCPDMDQ